MKALKALCGTLSKHTEEKKAFAAWPSALFLLAGALRAGLPLPDALGIMASEAPEPLRRRLVARAASAGDWAPIHERIERLFCEADLALPKAILLFSHESGGNMAQLLETCADLMEKKRELAEKAAALTAEGRMSAWVVGASPFTLLLLLAVIAPDFVRPLFALKAGRLLLALVVLLVAAGLYLVARAVRVEP